MNAKMKKRALAAAPQLKTASSIKTEKILGDINSRNYCFISYSRPL